jgi:Uma2 family endonuclease
MSGGFEADHRTAVFVGVVTKILKGLAEHGLNDGVDAGGREFGGGIGVTGAGGGLGLGGGLLAGLGLLGQACLLLLGLPLPVVVDLNQRFVGHDSFIIAESDRVGKIALRAINSSAKLINMVSDTTQLQPATVEHLSMYRLSVGQYHDMIRMGIFSEDDRVELIEGQLVKQMPKNPPHSSMMVRLGKLLRPIEARGMWVRCEQPMTLGESEPEPDFAIGTGDDSKFTIDHPTAGEVEMVIEVADTSLDFDRTTKLAMYARAGIASYAIIVIEAKKVELFTGPRADGSYDTRVELQSTDVLPVVVKRQVIGEIELSRVFL